ncbi:DUF262 domain-containing protein [Nonomuraea phyllanthi]|uniref:DUF262 domain-containing protein n=1 Tax=Nonomuraea phyllanthi TaxID=2219224 RepID=A0A5C4UTU5_9ACTN|nr:DUF262 domain-containing protein [Nonomuraea phyllanthi]KAB8182108.1 DUF262 domain-containing protein [Nonomuraea phyllanthi]
MGVSNEKIIDQVKDLLAGRIVIPSIQRDYVWSRSDVRDLLDSLYRGYPVGALLLWKTSQEPPFRKAGVVQTDNSKHTPLYLLDGQQRLTSLAWVYRPTSKADGKFIDIRFDLDNEEFVNPNAVQKKNPILIPVEKALQDDTELFIILKDAGIDPTHPSFDVYYKRLMRLKGIREYIIHVITHDSDDYEEVADIFARVNKGGRRLSKGDLVYSAIAARWSEGLDTMEAFHEKLGGIQFPLDREAILRLMSLLAGTGAKHIHLLRKEMNGDALKAAWENTETALMWAIDFLRGECGVPRSRILTSPNVVVVPAYMLFRRQNQLAPGEPELLRRWVYTSMAFSHYSLQVETKLDAEARIIDTRRGGDLFDELIRRASGPRSVGSPVHPTDLEQKYASNAFFNLLYIAALRSGVKDWKTNIKIIDQPLISSSAIEYHHVFPQAKVQGIYSKEQWNSIANLAFISAETNKFISAKFPEVYMSAFPVERLVEQWIPVDAELRKIENFPRFLEARRHLLVGVLNDMLGLPHYRQGMPRQDGGDLLEEDEDIYPDKDQAGPVLF